MVSRRIRWVAAQDSDPVFWLVNLTHNNPEEPHAFVVLQTTKEKDSPSVGLVILTAGINDILRFNRCLVCEAGVAGVHQ